MGRIGLTGRLAAAGLALATPTAIMPAETAQAPGEVAFPDGYRAWMHVKSGLLWPETPANAAFSGLHNIYANPAAVEGYGTGRFPEGSILVFDLFELASSPDDLQSGPRKAVDVMVRDLSAPDGWRFERFYGGRRADRADPQTLDACRACHLTESQGDMVFSMVAD